MDSFKAVKTHIVFERKLDSFSYSLRSNSRWLDRHRATTIIWMALNTRQHDGDDPHRYCLYISV